MWEPALYIFISVCCVSFAVHFFTRSQELFKISDKRERYHKVLSSPAVSFIVLRMIRELPVLKPQTKDEKRRMQKYNLLRARLDSLVEDKETLKQINSFIERKRNGN